MKKSFEKIRELMKRNATNRRGHKIADVTPEFHLKYAAGEMIELAAASRAAITEKTSCFRFDELQELADVFNCLVIYAESRGFTEEEIEREMLEKLRTRFLEEDKDE